MCVLSRITIGKSLTWRDWYTFLSECGIVPKKALWSMQTHDGEDEQGMDGEDDTDWTLASLRYGAADSNNVPNRATVTRLVKQMHDVWFRNASSHKPWQMSQWIWSQLRMPEGNFSWMVYERAMVQEKNRQHRVGYFMQELDMEEGTNLEYMQDIAQLQSTFQSFMIENSRVMCKLTPRSTERSIMLPETARPTGDGGDDGDENVISHDESKLTSWQNAFLFLRRVLEGCNYRRANGSFFERLITNGGLETQAFHSVITVSEFIAMHTSYDMNFKAWKWITHPTNNFESMVKYLSERPITEARDLEENCHIRSYAGDEYGRGSVIYDCHADMAFPYHLKEHWVLLAKQVTTARQRLFDSNYVCKPPDPSDVCVTHMQNAFPYDIAEEVREVARKPLKLCWREADAFECTHGKKFHIKCCPLGKYLHDAIMVDADDEPEIWGLTWQSVGDDVGQNALDRLVELDCTAEFKNMLPGTGFTREELSRYIHGEIGPLSCITNDDFVYVACLTPRRRLRAHITPNIWNALCGSELTAVAESYVTYETWSGREWICIGSDPPPNGVVVINESLQTLLTNDTVIFTREEFTSLSLGPADCGPDRYIMGHASRYYVPKQEPETTRYFRVHTGRTWRDCNIEELEHIYVCQKFVMHDRFMIYACKGRMFFEVGELDYHQLTLFFEGIGGSGKSTIMRAMQKFWPSHLRGIMSANIEPMFGMSSVLNGGKTRAIFCNEVSEDLQANQEEWQISCSGEEGSFAVKFKDPLVCICKAQHFWVGNGFPKRFKNKQGQVSRRLAGVLMAHSVQPRDGNIMAKIDQKMGHFQRKMTLAYHEFIRQTGTIDPMSTPETLPPAFRDYYYMGRRKTDPIEDFLSCKEYVEYREDAVLLMHDFRELYQKYRIKNEMGKAVKWGEDQYRTPFNERGLVVRRKDSMIIAGVAHNNVEIIIGLIDIST